MDEKPCSYKSEYVKCILQLLKITEILQGTNICIRSLYIIESYSIENQFCLSDKQPYKNICMIKQCFAVIYCSVTLVVKKTSSNFFCWKTETWQCTQTNNCPNGTTESVEHLTIRTKNKSVILTMLIRIASG